MTVEYLPVATAGGALVDSQANFAISGYQQNGFQVGIAQPSQANKVWRQSSMVAAAITNFIANVMGVNVLDDGNLALLIINFTNAIFKASDRVVAVAIAAGSPVFDCNLGNVFELILTQNCPTPTLINFTAGQRFTIILREDGVGGRTFTPPGSLPLADITTAPNTVNIQEFVVRADGTVIYPRTTMNNA